MTDAPEPLEQGAVGDHEDDLTLQEVLRSQKQWQATIDAVEDYIFAVDRNERVLRVNLSFSKSVGLHPREIIGRQLRDLVSFELPRPACGMKGIGHGTGNHQQEMRIGDETYFVSVNPARFGDVDVCVYVMRNITELINLKNTLYQSYRIASLGRLVSGVAHEINNPLTGILGFAELLGLRATEEKDKVQIGKITAAALRCKKIVESLLCFSRQQAPQKNLDSINDVIDRTLDLRAYWIRKRNVELVKEYGEIPLAMIDSQQVQQVILNLLLNAEQAIEEKGIEGRIVITTGQSEDRKRFRVWISDNGIGIADQHKERIFDPFFTTRPVQQGAGLGLSISHGIVTEHGGTIRVESRKGEGATFVVEIPLK